MLIFSSWINEYEYEKILSAKDRTPSYNFMELLHHNSTQKQKTSIS